MNFLTRVKRQLRVDEAAYVCRAETLAETRDGGCLNASARSTADRRCAQARQSPSRQHRRTPSAWYSLDTQEGISSCACRSTVYACRMPETADAADPRQAQAARGQSTWAERSALVNAAAWGVVRPQRSLIHGQADRNGTPGTVLGRWSNAAASRLIPHAMAAGHAHMGKQFGASACNYQRKLEKRQEQRR